MSSFFSAIPQFQQHSHGKQPFHLHKYLPTLFCLLTTEHLKAFASHEGIDVPQGDQMLQLVDMVTHLFHLLKQQRIYQSMIINHMANLTVFVIFALLLGFTSATVQFIERDTELTINANWLQDSSELQPYVEKYQLFLAKPEIKSVNLSFSYCKNPEYILSNFFSQPIQVQALSLNLDTCKIGDKGIKQILDQINQKSIQYLHLILSSTKSTPNVGRILGERISKFNLKSLKLSLMMLRIGDKGLSDLFLKPLGPQIQELSLDLTTNKLGQTSFSNFTHFVSNIQSQKLTTVEIIVHGNRIQSNGTLDIAKSLKRFRNLTTLKFDAYFNNLKTAGAKPITLLVKILPKLKVLSLNFDLNYIETQGGRLIGTSIEHLKELQFLQIGVSTKNFGYNGYHHIIKGMKHLKKLKFLNFRCGVNRIGTKAAKNFEELLLEIPELQYLELHLQDNFMLDEGLETIVKAIEKLEYLKSLVLNFGFNDVQKQGMQKLFEMIERKNLTKTWVGLSNNPLKDDEIKLALPSLQKVFQKCQKFELEFLYTKISESLMNFIRKQFEVFEKNNCEVTFHANNEDEVNRVQKQMQKLDDEDRKAQESQL